MIFYDNVEDTSSGQSLLSTHELHRTSHFDSQNQQFHDDRVRAVSSVQCPLQRNQTFEMGLHLLAEIEAHVATSRVCHHLSLQELVFHGSIDIDGTTPLLLACHYGELDCVKHIVENWGVDVNSAAVYYLDPFKKYAKIQGATPLFVAAFRRDLSIAKYLVEKGANLNLKTSVQNKNLRHEFSCLTPLQGAVQWPVSYQKSCKKTSADITNMVLFLLESRADPSSLSPLPLNGHSIWQNTMCGVDVTNALVDHGIDLNQRSSDGETILHYWAGTDHSWVRLLGIGNIMTVVQKLVDKGADPMARNNMGTTPIFEAISAANWPVVDFLLQRKEVDRMDKIEAMELAAATILRYHPDHVELERALGYWRQALRLRQMEHNSDQKTPITLKSGRSAEWTTIEQLEHHVANPFGYQLQSYYIRLRIFSSLSWEAVSTLRHSFLVCIDFLWRAQRYVDLLDILWATLEVIRRSHSIQEESLCSMTDIVIHNGVELLSMSLELNDPLFTNISMTPLLEVIVATNPFSSSYFADGHMRTLLQLVDYFASLTEIPNQDKMLLRQLVSQDCRDSRGRSLLKMECEDRAVRLPSINLLLQSGADPNAGDVDGNGPLHALASNNYCYCEELAKAAHSLLAYGAHLDRVNNQKETAAQVWTEGGVLALPEWLREPGAVPKLQCLSAKVVRSENVEYDELTLPAVLCTFAELH